MSASPPNADIPRRELGVRFGPRPDICCFAAIIDPLRYSITSSVRASSVAAIDMCVVPTATFELLFVFLVLGHGRRRLLWFEVTRRPTAEWLARQITEAFPWAPARIYLVRDRTARRPGRRGRLDPIRGRIQQTR